MVAVVVKAAEARALLKSETDERITKVLSGLMNNISTCSRDRVMPMSGRKVAVGTSHRSTSRRSRTTRRSGSNRHKYRTRRFSTRRRFDRRFPRRFSPGLNGRHRKDIKRMATLAWLITQPKAPASSGAQ